jgi:hypothetical protein
MGYADTSGHLGGGVRRELFDPFPMLKERLGVRTSDDFLEEPAYRFWFLVRGDEPLLGFEAGTGSAVSLDGAYCDLMDLYRTSNRRLWPVIWKVAGQLL